MTNTPANNTTARPITSTLEVNNMTPSTMLNSATVPALKKIAARRGIALKPRARKAEIIAAIIAAPVSTHTGTDLTPADALNNARADAARARKDAFKIARANMRAKYARNNDGSIADGPSAAARAFYDAAAFVGLEDLTDSAPYVENGREYQDASLILRRGRGKRAEIIARAKIPATRGRVNYLAWLASMNDGHGVPSPESAPDAYVTTDAPVNGARALNYADGTPITNADGAPLYVKQTRDGARPIARKMGLTAFIKEKIAPVVGAFVWEGIALTGAGTYSIGLEIAHNVVF